MTTRGVLLCAACAAGVALAGCGREDGATAIDMPDAACAAGDWPGDGGVGIPDGTPELTVLEGDRHTEAAGQVFDAVELRGRLYVDHPDVVIRRSRLVGDIYYAVYTTEGGVRLTIEDCDIVGGILISDGFVGRRNHLHAPAGGYRDDGWIFAASDVVLEDNRIDGLLGDVGAHVDGVQIMAGDNVVIRRNYIDAASPPIENGGVNAAIFFAPDFGPISNVAVDCNMLIAPDGYYPLRIYDTGGTVDVRHNRWSRDHLGAPVHVEETTVTTWEDNAYVDGEAIPAP
jgi:hypothetical protein